MRTLCVILLIILLLCIPAIAIPQIQPDLEVNATAYWSPPTTGTPVVYYLLQYKNGLDDWVEIGSPTDTLFVFQLRFWDTHQIRVAGVDSAGNIGPFSTPSAIYAPADSIPHPIEQPVKQ